MIFQVVSRLKSTFCTALFAVSLLVYAATLQAADHQLVDRVVAVVNQEAITQSELDELFYSVREQLSEAYQGSELKEKLLDARKKLLSQLIEDRLVLQEARKRGVEVSDQEVEGRLEDFKKQLPPGQSFDDMLEHQGLDGKAVKQRIHDQLMMQKLQYVEIQRKIVVSPVEIEKFYKDNTARFVAKEKLKVWTIVIPKSEDAVRKGMMDETAKKKAETILEELKKGADFSELAKRESHDSHAQEGGLIGFVARGDMIKEIEDVLFSLPENGRSEIVETEGAYHIFKIAERAPEKGLSLDEVRSQIHDILYRDKANARFEAWMEELKKSAFISIR
ncbi:MAG: peptidylprolyl isomerase [Candidatus Omnitrophica bacterium]|nr:peptidylprolyl isomerase [Candidatus Omnitrophota bacterium]